MTPYTRDLWGVLHSFKDGRAHLHNNNLLPVLFTTRREAKDYIRTHFAWLRDRRDLHELGWRIPRPVRVRITTLNQGKHNEEARHANVAPALREDTGSQV